jgi:hypothetical protein
MVADEEPHRASSRTRERDDAGRGAGYAARRMAIDPGPPHGCSPNGAADKGPAGVIGHAGKGLTLIVALHFGSMISG